MRLCVSQHFFFIPDVENIIVLEFIVLFLCDIERDGEYHFYAPADNSHVALYVFHISCLSHSCQHNSREHLEEISANWAQGLNPGTVFSAELH